MEEIPCVIGGQNVESDDVRWETSVSTHNKVEEIKLEVCFTTVRSVGFK